MGRGLLREHTTGRGRRDPRLADRTVAAAGRRGGNGDPRRTRRATRRARRDASSPSRARVRAVPRVVRSLWFPYLVTALPLMASTLHRALLLPQPALRGALTAALALGWLLLQLVGEQDDLVPIGAHLLGLVILLAVALAVLARRDVTASRRASPHARPHERPRRRGDPGGARAREPHPLRPEDAVGVGLGAVRARARAGLPRRRGPRGSAPASAGVRLLRRARLGLSAPHARQQRRARRCQHPRVLADRGRGVPALSPLRGSRARRSPSRSARHPRHWCGRTARSRCRTPCSDCSASCSPWRCATHARGAWPAALIASAGLGLAAGFRQDVLLLLGPLWLWMLAARSWRERVMCVGALGVAALAWFVPSAVLSGGAAAYLASLGGQAGRVSELSPRRAATRCCATRCSRSTRCGGDSSVSRCFSSPPSRRGFSRDGGSPRMRRSSRSGSFRPRSCT